MFLMYENFCNFFFKFGLNVYVEFIEVFFPIYLLDFAFIIFYPVSRFRICWLHRVKFSEFSSFLSFSKYFENYNFFFVCLYAFNFIFHIRPRYLENLQELFSLKFMSANSTVLLLSQALRCLTFYTV